MFKRLLLYLVAMGILLSVAISADQWDEGTTLLQEHADQISDYLGQQEAEGLTWLRANRVPLESVLDNRPPADWGATLDQLAQRDYTLLIHRADSLVFWSNTKALPGKTKLAQLADLRGRTLLRMPLGNYLAYTEPFGDYFCTVLVPARYAAGLHSTRREALFPADAHIPAQVKISPQSDYPLVVNGQTIGGITADGAVHLVWLQWVKLIFYALFFGVLLMLVGQAADGLARRFSPWVGATGVAAAAAGLIFLNRITGFGAQEFGTLPWFAHAFQQPAWLGHTLGDWLFGIVLTLWAALQVHRRLSTVALAHLPGPVRLALAGTGYVLTMLVVRWSVQLLSHLVLQSGLEFDFDNLLNLRGLSLTALAGLFLWLPAMFLTGQRLVQIVATLDLTRPQRAIILAGASLVFLGLCFTAGLPINVLYVAVCGLLFALLLDVLAHDAEPGFGWIVIWLLLFAGFSAVFLYRFNALKDKQLRREYAQVLATDRDTEWVEKTLLYNLLTNLELDSAKLGVLLKPWPFKAQADDIRAQMNSALFDENYLFQHYQLNAFAFDKDNQPILLGQTQGYAWVVEENWKQGQPLPGAPQIRYRTGPDGQFRYMMVISTRRMGDPAQPARVFAFLEHHYPKPTRVYARMFYSTPYKKLEGLARYDFAVQKKGQFLVEQGRANLLQLAPQIRDGESREVETPAQNRVDAVYKSADGLTATAVGHSNGGWFKPLYLFSLLFTAASLLLAVLAFANNYFHFLPTDYRFSFSTRGSLAKRIHYSNLSVIGLAFLVVGFITYRHFSRSAAEVEQNYADYRTSAALTGLKTRLVDASLPADSLRRALPATLATLAGSLTMDANLYAPTGELVYTTQPDLGKIGVLPPKMSPSALFALRYGGQPEAVETEKIGGLPFYTKYLPLRDGQNQLRGFLGVPYNLAQRTVGVEVSDFIGLLASVYVFLLLIAFGATFLLARSITRPVTMIAEKIRELQLQDKNALLEYKGDAQDEVSDLIGEYNRMVDKLEASKVQMVRLEREGAWREMARQVAHDIKNPLTTMKLSMQQLERVSNNPEQAAAYLRKAITRLIEQIDSLAQIASEFSMFANIDIKQRDPVKLNEMVESVFDLFSEQRNVDMKLTPSTENFTILGDKNHLIRVFNNLVINAIQSIPSDREGKIQVSVFRQDRMAVVKISDNGGGIPPEIRQRVFEPNFTTKTSGSGLGLAICRKIIEGHDGDIRFETRDNEGTDFFVELPISAFEPVGKRALVESE